MPTEPLVGPRSCATVGPPTRCRRRVVVVGALMILLAAVAGAYSSSYRGEFQFDDGFGITRNPLIKDLGLFTTDHVVSRFWLNRSLTDLTFAIDYRQARLDPRMYHATSLALHLVAVVLVLLFTRRLFDRAALGRRDGLAFVVAAAFGLHPIQTEAVSYVIQRAEVLASVFYLLTMLFLLDAEERPGLRGAASYVVALAAFTLGLGAKQIVVTAPLAFLLCGLCLPLRTASHDPRRAWVRRIVLAAPLLAGSLAASASNLASLHGSTSAGFDVPGLGPGRYFLTELRAFVIYLRLLVWPAGQNVDWQLAPSDGLLEPRTLAAALGIGAVLGTALLLLRWAARRPSGSAGAGAARIGAFGVLWFFTLLAPTSTVVALADVLVEHRLYLASWGVLTAILVGAAGAWGRLSSAWRLPRYGAEAAALCVLSALSIACYSRNQVWSSRQALWSDAVAKSPSSSRAHGNLGDAFAAQGLNDAAVGEYRQALRNRGDGKVPVHEILRSLGASLLLLGRTDEAQAAFIGGLEVAPGQPDLLNGLASTLLRKGDLDGAEKWVRKALERFPGHGEARNTLGQVLLERRDLRGALHEFMASSYLDPDDPDPVYNAARAQERFGMAAASCASWVRLLEIDEIPASLEEEAHQHIKMLRCAARHGDDELPP
jgi:Flp pilus assembly protein TadD